MFNSNNGYSLADVAAATGNNRNNDGMWGDGGWWIILLFLVFGWSGYGFGGFGGMGGANSPGLQGIATRADINEGFALNDIQNGIRGIQQGICDSTYALNNTMQSGFNNANVAMLQGFNGVQQAINADTVANMQNTNALQTQLANCCCENREGQAQIRYDMATNTCALQNTMNNNTRDIIDNQNAGTREILNYLCQKENADLRAQVQKLELAASQSQQNAYITANQEAQTAELIRRINPMPVPAYTVPAPYAYTGCGCNSGCC